MVSSSFVFVQVVTGSWIWQITSINIAAATIFAFVPWLQRFGELVAPLTFVGAAYITVFATIWDVGTDSGAQFFLLVGRLSGGAAAGDRTHCVGGRAGGDRRRLVIALEFLVPHDTGLQPAWAQSMGFVVTSRSPPA